MAQRFYCFLSRRKNFCLSERSVNNIKLLFKAGRKRAARKLMVLRCNFSRSNVSKLIRPILCWYARTGNVPSLLFTTGASTFQPPPSPPFLPCSFIPRFAASLILRRGIHRTCVCVYVRRNDYVIRDGKKLCNGIANNFNRIVLLTLLWKEGSTCKRQPFGTRIRVPTWKLMMQRKIRLQQIGLIWVKVKLSLWRSWASCSLPRWFLHRALDGKARTLSFRKIWTLKTWCFEDWHFFLCKEKNSNSNFNLDCTISFPALYPTRNELGLDDEISRSFDSDSIEKEFLTSFKELLKRTS